MTDSTLTPEDRQRKLAVLAEIANTLKANGLTAADVYAHDWFTGLQEDAKGMECTAHELLDSILDDGNLDNDDILESVYALYPEAA